MESKTPWLCCRIRLSLFNGGRADIGGRMATKAPGHVQNGSRRRPSGTLIAAAASVGAIALAGLALVFLQAPDAKSTRPAPAENAALPTESPPPTQMPRAGPGQGPAAPRSETSTRPTTGMLPAQA